MKTYEGGCHCGRVRYRIRVEELSTAVACNCSICEKKGFLHLIVPLDEFELLRGSDDLSTYEFNTRTAKHKFCRHCGIHSFYSPRSDPDKVDVNVRCLDSVDPSLLSIRPFHGRNWEEAMAARSPEA